MNKNHVYHKPEIVEGDRDPKLELEKLEKENNNNMYKIVGIIDGHYIVKTHKGFRKVKAIESNKKNVRDEIRIEKL